MSATKNSKIDRLKTKEDTIIQWMESIQKWK